MNELLFSITKKDLKVNYFSGTGPGGQNRNKNQNCVRIQHKDSGAIVTGQSNKSRKANIREAMDNLVNHPKFKVWHNRKIMEVLEGKTIEELVDEQLVKENLLIEGKNESNEWAELKF